MRIFPSRVGREHSSNFLISSLVLPMWAFTYRRRGFKMVWRNEPIRSKIPLRLETIGRIFNVSLCVFGRAWNCWVLAVDGVWSRCMRLGEKLFFTITSRSDLFTTMRRDWVRSFFSLSYVDVSFRWFKVRLWSSWVRIITISPPLSLCVTVMSFLPASSTTLLTQKVTGT